MRSFAELQTYSFCSFARAAAGSSTAAARARVAAQTGASAAVVCNDDGDCWRVKEKYEYLPEFNVRVYGDDWRWDEKDSKKYRWREARDGRSYWRKGAWIDF